MMTREVQDLRRSDHYPLPHLRLQLHWGSLAASWAGVGCAGELDVFLLNRYINTIGIL